MTAIYSFFGTILEFFSKLTGGSYLFGILILALIIKILLVPFGIKQQKNSVKLARLRPKEAAIKKKYAGRNDRPTQTKMNEEVQGLY
ncbi:MAG: YidC/Oxa1 family membrane protein insertase, partial [Clostridia bacterium]|nr:YidC/Oxa1 family membrane protein insertase [Clostridia bacterium]